MGHPRERLVEKTNGAAEAAPFFTYRELQLTQAWAARLRCLAWLALRVRSRACAAPWLHRPARRRLRQTWRTLQAKFPTAPLPAGCARSSRKARPDDRARRGQSGRAAQPGADSPRPLRTVLV